MFAVNSRSRSCRRFAEFELRQVAAVRKDVEYDARVPDLLYANTTALEGPTGLWFLAKSMVLS